MEINELSLQLELKSAREQLEASFIRLRGVHEIIKSNWRDSLNSFAISHITADNPFTDKAGRKWIILDTEVNDRYDIERVDSFSIHINFAQLEAEIKAPTQKEKRYLNMYREFMQRYLHPEPGYSYRQDREASKKMLYYAASVLRDLKHNYNPIIKNTWEFTERSLIERDSLHFNLKSEQDFIISI